MSFTYNDEGIRASKTVNGVTTHYYLNGSQILAEETNGNITLYVYDVSGSPIGYQYHGANYAADAWDIYWYEKNLQGDIIAVYNQAGTKLVYYRYTAYGEFSTHSAITGVDAATFRNPFTYRGYYYDYDLGMYYLNSRYYDANTCRFINADGYVSTGTGLLGYNMYAYCNNNPVNRVDPTGEAWWHWAIGAAIVVACAAATVVTCGGFAAAAGAVVAVGSGVAAATTASTIAAGAFIGSAVAYGSAALLAVSTSHSVEEFNEQGDWGTVAATAGGAILNGIASYVATRTQATTTIYRSVSDAEAQDIKNTGRFNLSPNGMECKQFGFNLSETRRFGNMVGQENVVSAKIPTDMIKQFYTGGVDTSIFRSGTLTVYGDQLEAFNQAVLGTIKFIP